MMERGKIKVPLNRCLVCMKEIGPGQSVCPHCNSRVPCAPNPEGCLQPGYRLPRSSGRYVIGRAIGRGGFGITYIAFDTRLQAVRCIKEYFPKSCKRRADMTPDIVPGEEEQFKKYSDRFLEEARLMSDLSEKKVPHVVDVYDQLEENNTNYIVMKYLNGCTMDEYIRKHGGLGWREAKNVMEAVLETVGAIHQLGYLHRDISLNNVFRLTDGSVCVIDLGCAEPIEKARNYPERITQSSKKYYSPPEQVRRGPQGQWTDTYAAGMCMFKLVAGGFPESLGNGQMLPSLRSLGYNVPPAYDAVIQKAVQQEPGKRYASAGAMLEDVGRILITGPTPPPPKPPVPPDAGQRTNDRRPSKWLRWILICVGAALIGLVIYLIVHPVRPEPMGKTENKASQYAAEPAAKAPSPVPLPVSTPLPQPAAPTPEPAPHVSISVQAMGDGRTLACDVQIVALQGSRAEAYLVKKGKNGANNKVRALELRKYAADEKILLGLSADQAGWALKNNSVDMTGATEGEYTLMVHLARGEMTYNGYGNYVQFRPAATPVIRPTSTPAPAIVIGPVSTPTSAPAFSMTASPTPPRLATPAPARTPTPAALRTPTPAPMRMVTALPTVIPARIPAALPTSANILAPTAPVQPAAVTTPAPAAPVSSSARSAAELGLKYNVVNGCIEISNYTDKMPADLVIPEKLDGYTVVSIGKEAFNTTHRSPVLTSIVFPDTVHTIGVSAFSQNKLLQRVTLPKKLSVIEDDAFSLCISVKEFILPDTLTRIGNYAFDSCYSLESISIPDTVTRIGWTAFAHCASLKTVKLPRFLTTIQNYVFTDCASLERVEVPSMVKKIGVKAFYDCPSLVSVSIPSSVTEIGENAFGKCPRLTVTVTSGSYAEKYCKRNKIAYTVE